MSGAWERMIRTVRELLASLTSEKNLDDDVLYTLLLGVEAMINSRPLTDVFMDVDADLPLTPNHLLRVDPFIGLPAMLTVVKDNYAGQRYRTVQLVADEFWRRWVQEHPRTLYPRTKWHKRRENVSLNDIVLVSDHTLPRGVWPLGRVIKLYSDVRGVVRVVNLKTASGILKRPVAKFCVIVKARLQPFTVLFSFIAILVCFTDAQIYLYFHEKMSGFERQ